MTSQAYTGRQATKKEIMEFVLHDVTDQSSARATKSVCLSSSDIIKETPLVYRKDISYVRFETG